ncbi:MAG: aminomethyl-transferring glycine dehydrogenase subunit GcvPA [Candidatus Amulumruptor caecigallinarius]|nr:aminomethyl-transferring glycine dehydrogenase subunit GcvPA [Candidatus Amulumruptor caecigallinarius]MCM1396452.1 aminomethyl-transferring glycine dehydrogenase subunit GcvPA [Candidatus Amulumruptor caecigallinarius]MCM1453491.1 aminomethyl-transferring glycine dehydrogenase subunit GcvPA [bacterium]
MTHPYLPHTEADIRGMLDVCGADTLADFYADVPPELLLNRPYRLPGAMTEDEVRRYFDALSRENRQLVCFAGAGWYDHASPSLARYITSRSEFLTAYTPYQPEISQGTLAYIFEYQSMMASLTGMDVSNASMYDGATATAEAMLMAVGAARKCRRVLMSATLNPAVRRVVATYARYHGVELLEVPEADGITDLGALSAMLAEGPVAGVIMPQPNYYGIIEDLTGVADAVHAAKGLLIVNAPAMALGILRSPGEWGADIACGEAQSLGMPLSFGGPYLGYLCCRRPLMRKLPGRIVGATTDAAGQRCFVLTLQAREQHIRRDKATSNICSNQSLMALYAAIYLSLAGADGLRDICRASHAGLCTLTGMLTATGRMRRRHPGRPVLYEAPFDCDFNPPELIDAAAGRGILAGVQLDDSGILIAVTERRTREEMELLAEVVTSLPSRKP